MTSILKLAGFLMLLACSNIVYPQSTYVRHNVANSRVVVFVHGVMGSASDTWTNGKTKAYWPALLTKDKAFDGTDIFVVEYPSPSFDTAPNIDELAEELRLQLESSGVMEHAHLIFVVHSMGGLVTRAYLAKYRHAASKVSFIYFLATPTTGASIASVAKLASRNPQFSKMMPMTSDAYLADLQRTWLAAPELSSIPSFCAYEVLPMFGSKIVEQQSATNLCNRRVDPINETHAGISKPRDANDAPYIAFKSAYSTLQAVGGNALRVEVEDIRQIKRNVKGNVVYKDQPVFCDSVQLVLLTAHTDQSEAPVNINSIAIHSEQVPDFRPSDLHACAIDPLSARPYGIVNVDTFLLTIDETAIRGKLIQDGMTAIEVKPDNLLSTSKGSRAVTLKSGEEPISFKVLVETKAKTARRVWFVTKYDDGAPQTISTKPIIIWR